MSRQIQVIPQVAEYFGTDEIPIIGHEFTPGKGWKSAPWNKRVSRSYLRKLQRDGVTHVGLLRPGYRDRFADFSIEELLKVDRTSLLGGNVI